MKKVLIVEDETILSLVHQKCVQRLNYGVVDTVKSGQAAIDAVKKFSPDLILMDIKLEGMMDGIEAMEEIRKFSTAEVIYVSGISEQRIKERASKTNMLGFIIKPLTLTNLTEILTH